MNPKAPQPLSPGLWGRTNGAILRGAGWLLRLRHAWAARAFPQVSPPALASAELETAGGEPVHLVLCWGRLGDAVMARGWLQRLTERLAGKVVLLGRPETRTLVADLVDAFEPLSGGVGEVLQRLNAHGPFASGITDVHWFHGAELRWPGLFGALPIARRIGFAGYAPVARVAPARPWPGGVALVEGVPVPGTGRQQPHIIAHQQHYLAGIAAELAPVGLWRDADDTATMLIPPSVPSGWGVWQPDKGPLRIACQPSANIPKKDLPTEVWRQVFSALPEAHFVLLGTAAQRETLAAMAGGDAGAGLQVESVAGQTDLQEAAEILRRCDAFVGVDSGLAHVACAMGVPTVVVSPNNNLGAFFPWPAAYRRGPQWVDISAAHMDCGGCFTNCLREPLWRGRAAGLPCIRNRGPESIAAALLQVMGIAGPLAEEADRRSRTALDGVGNCKRRLQSNAGPA